MQAAKSLSYKKQVVQHLSKLSADDLQEILDFTEFILTKRHQIGSSTSVKRLVPEKDPILKLIGKISIKPFSCAIDEELYG
ncbi:MAG: hypothetical protein HZB62_07380 [Nitrospirae bacterium]|nr:hypothetical protein [Nitrospirota bacterium]